MVSERDKELTLINYIIKAPEVYRDNKEALKGFKTEYPYAKPIYNFITETIDRYGQAPVVVEAITMANEWADSHNYSEIQRNKLIEDTRETYNLESSPKSGELLLDHIFEQRSRELTIKLGKSSPAEFRRNYEQFMAEMRGLNSLGGDEKKSLGVAPMSRRDVGAICAKIHESNTLSCMPTGFDKWDEKLLGGVRAGEVFMMLGSTGRCKTLFMLNVAYHNAVERNKRFVMITMDNQMEEIGERWIARWLNRPICGAFNPAKTEKLIEKKIKTGQEFNLILQTWQPQRHTILDVERYLNELEVELYAYDKTCNVRPEKDWGKIDGLGIDYLEKLKAIESTDLLRRDIYLTCDETVGLAKRKVIPVFLNSQANIESMKAETSQIWMSGESSSKLQPPAHVAIMSQNDQQRQSNPEEMMVVLGKSRRPETEYAIPVIVDKFTQHMYEHPTKPIVPLLSITSTSSSALKTKEEHKLETNIDTDQAAREATSRIVEMHKKTLQVCQNVVESDDVEYGTQEAVELALAMSPKEMALEEILDIRRSTPEEQAEYEASELAHKLTNALKGAV